MSEKALVPVEQKEVKFYDDEIVAVRLDSGQVFIPLRPVCELIGVDWSAQRQRINRDAVLSKKIKGVVVTTTPGGDQEMSCLPLEYLNGWLFGINVSRVRPEIQEQLLRYQEECFLVLAEAFQEGRLTIGDDKFADILASADPAEVQALHMAQAIVRLAQNQIRFSARITGRLDAIEEKTTGQLNEHETRLANIEEQLNPGRTITESQAMQISQGVKAVAMELGKKTKRNEYGGVYGELYRRYEINSYKLLPAGKFEDAMNWLNEWLQQLMKDIPF